MRYTIFTIEEEIGEQCIRDMEQGFIPANPQMNGGDIVAIRPSPFAFPASYANWPENARRIVALLNYAELHQWETFDIEQHCRDLENDAMVLPPEAHVEFADDRKFLPVTPAITEYICLKCKSPLRSEYDCDNCGDFGALENPVYTGG